MSRILCCLVVVFIAIEVNAEHFNCLGVFHTTTELADMNDLKLKTTYCQLGDLRNQTEVRGIGISEDYRQCSVTQGKIIELLRVEKINCNGAIPL